MLRVAPTRRTPCPSRKSPTSAEPIRFALPGLPTTLPCRAATRAVAIVMRWVQSNRPSEAIPWHRIPAFPSSRLQTPCTEMGNCRTACLYERCSVRPDAMSEWGPSSWTNTGSAWGAEFAKFNYRAGSAAWAASFIRESIRASFTGGAILLMRDQLGNNTIGSPGVPSLTYFQNGIDFPKPYTNQGRDAEQSAHQRQEGAIAAACAQSLGRHPVGDYQGLTGGFVTAGITGEPPPRPDKPVGPWGWPQVGRWYRRGQPARPAVHGRRQPTPGRSSHPARPAEP